MLSLRNVMSSCSLVVVQAKALIRAIQANQKLTHLDLSCTHSVLNRTPRLKRIFKAIEITKEYAP